MKRFITHIAIALTMFIAGTTITSLFPAFQRSSEPKPDESTASRLAEETEIILVIFRHQIDHDPNLGWNTYYLSCHNYSDPPEEVMTYLAKNGLPVKPLSQVQYGSYYQHRTFLRVGSIKWLSETEVMVGGSSRDWRDPGTRAYIYRLVREEGRWKVISTETIS